MNAIETYLRHDFKIVVSQDEDAQNPREDDNLATLALFHKRYVLGDKDHGFDHSDYRSWDELEDAIRKQEDPAVILPVYMIDHSGISVRTTSFNDCWDSGQVGFAWITKAQASKEYGWKRLSSKRIAKLKEHVVNEVQTYDDYLTGSVYVVSVENPDGEVVESCGGYCGSASVEEDGYAIKEAKATADRLQDEWNCEQARAALPENRPDQMALGLPGIP